MAPAVRVALVLGAAGLFCFAQERPDPAAYERFFQDVSVFESASSQAASNGDDAKPVFPKIQEKIGLTDAEGTILNATADDCVSRLAALRPASARLTLQSRIEFAGYGKHSDELTQKLKDLEDQRNQLVSDHVQQLRAALSEASFAKVDAYVHLPPKVAPTSAKPMPVRK
jgi:uncharacterized protein YhaN